MLSSVSPSWFRKLPTVYHGTTISVPIARSNYKYPDFPSKSSQSN